MNRGGPARKATDAELVVAAASGDKAAFSVLLGRHQGTARRLAGRTLRDQRLAEDAAQEAAVQALLSIGRLNIPSSFGSWLCGITLNVSRRMLHQHLRERPLPQMEPLGLSRGADDEALDALIAERVRAAVEDLAAGQRQAVVLFYLQGLTHRETAAELGVTVGAVKARLHQARSRLGMRLAPQLHEEEPMTPPSPPAPQQDWVEVSVAEIRRGDSDEAAGVTPHVIVLADDHDRQLPLYVGAAEATALALCLESIEMPRPMTYQFSASLLEASGSRVREVQIARLEGGTFYGVVVIEGPQGHQEVDARPSDAINLAALTSAPVKVAATLLADPAATQHTAWRDYSTTGPDIAQQAVENLQEALSRFKGKEVT